MVDKKSYFINFKFLVFLNICEDENKTVDLKAEIIFVDEINIRFILTNNLLCEWLRNKMQWLKQIIIAWKQSEYFWREYLKDTIKNSFENNSNCNRTTM